MKPDSVIGIAFGDAGMAFCHTVWQQEKLVIHDFWVGKNGDAYLESSSDEMVSALYEKISAWDIRSPRSVGLYCQNQIAITRINQLLNECCANRRISFSIQPSLITNPAEAGEFLCSELRDRRVFATESATLPPLEEAFRGIQQDKDTGKPIGSPESLALLFGLGEPTYQRLKEEVDRVNMGNVAASRISALVG